MNFGDKVNLVRDYCEGYVGCEGCPFDDSLTKWCVNGTSMNMTEYELDEMLKVFNGDIDSEEEPDMVNHPKHYNRDGAMECIEEMIVVFGIVPTYHFCRLNAWKYRYRQNDKGGLLDMEKSDNYIRKAAELKVRMKQEGAYDHRTEGI